MVRIDRNIEIDEYGEIVLTEGIDEYGEIVLNDENINHGHPQARNISRFADAKVLFLIVGLIIVSFLFSQYGGNFNSLTSDNWHSSQLTTHNDNVNDQVPSQSPVTNKIVFSYHTNSYDKQSHSIPFTLNSPPLEVTYSVTPEMIEHQKMVYSSPSSTRGRLITTEIPNSNSWFEIVITDSSGKRILETGYGNPPYSKSGYGNLEGSYKIYSAGDYVLNINFNNVIVDVEISQQ